MDDIINWCRHHSLIIFRWAVGLVFLWFGLLKFLPDPGEAEILAYRTIKWLSGNAIPQRTALVGLGVLETIIGIGLLLHKAMPLILVLLFMQLGGTLLPLIIFPNECWAAVLKPTLAGHYIIKNLVLIAGAVVLTATVSKAGEEERGQEETIGKRSKV